MDRQRKRRDLIQNITISLLSVSAVLLFTQTQLYNLAPDSGQFAPLSITEAPVEDSQISAPVRVAISGAYGRYGSITLTTADERFVPLSALLREAMGSAQTSAPCKEADFLSALSRTSVYYDFLEPLPLSVLAGLVDASAGPSAPSVRQLAVSVEKSGAVRLFLWDGGRDYRVCATAVTEEDLSALVNRYELGGASFAFDHAELDGHADSVAPRSLFLDPLPELPILSVSDPLTDTDRVLSILDFNPHSNFRHTESSGTQVIVEEARSLRIHPDGTIRYQSGGEPTLDIESAGQRPTLLEAARGAGALLSQLLDGLSGDASLYLCEVLQSGDVTTLRFRYQAGGVPIRFAGGGAAAEVTLTGSAVTSVTLRFRQYTATTDLSLLLPLRQTLAITALAPGSELSIGYADTGAETVSAGWLSD